MEVYILDDQLRRTEVFDQFQSVIWTERFQDVGDFEMVITSSYSAKKWFVPGAWVATNVSNRMMLVENSYDQVDTQGRKTLKVTGVSFEVWMKDRVTLEAYVNGTAAAPTWTITDTPGNVIREIFRLKCKDNATPASDNFPFIATGNLYPADTISEPTTQVVVEIEADTIFNVVQNLSQVFDFGFRLTRNLENSQMFFNVYTGNDRTTHQTQFAPVVFASELDNLQNTSTLLSNVDQKNVAYVYAKNGTQVVYANGGDSSKTGFQRRILKVDASDVDLEAGPELNRIMNQRGLAELAKHTSISGFDGEIPQSNSYVYDVDYQLGDLVEMRNSTGVANVMRVTEQIFSQDAQGFKSYPTLTVNEVITPGTWSSWETNYEWINAVGTWAEK